MQKIVVIGCPGAGKTEFSKQLAARTSLPLIHLDRIYHDPKHAYTHNRTAWRATVQQEIAKDRWILDGNYASSFDLRLPAADTIIFLDYPTYVSALRAIKRRWHFRRRVRTDMPASWQEQLSWRFWLHIVRFNRREAPEIRALLTRYVGDKRIEVFRRPAEAEAYLASFRAVR